MAANRVLTKANLCCKLSFDKSFKLSSGSVVGCLNKSNSKNKCSAAAAAAASDHEAKKIHLTPPDWVSGSSAKFPADRTKRIVQFRNDWVCGSQKLLEGELPNENPLITAPSTENWKSLSAGSTVGLGSPNEVNNSSSELKHEITKSVIRANISKGVRNPSKRNKYTIGPERIQSFFDPLYLGYILKNRKYSTCTRQCSGSDPKYLRTTPSNYKVFQYNQNNAEKIHNNWVAHYSTDFTGSTQPQPALETGHCDNSTSSSPSWDSAQSDNSFSQDDAVPQRIQRIPKLLEWSYLSVGDTKPLLGMTMGQTIDRASDLFGDREAVVSMHQGIRKTFTQLQKDSTEVAAGLVALGLEPGEHLGIWSPNNYEWMVTLFAAAKAGLVLVTINPGYRPNELERCLNTVSVKAIICATTFKTSDYYSMLSSIAPELASTPAGGRLTSPRLPHLANVIMIGGEQRPGTVEFADLPSLSTPSSREAVAALEHRIQFDQPCIIQFTSGTTGVPKGAVLSHHNIVNNGYFIGDRLNYDEQVHRICLSVPLYHCFGNVAGAINGALHGAACVLPSDAFSGEACVKSMKEESITSVYGTPTMFVDMLAASRKAGFVPPSTLCTGIMGGASCPTELVHDVINELNLKDLAVVYGMTETSPNTFQCFTDDPPHLRTTTIGFPSSHTEVKIVDTEGRTTPVGVEGELCVRGYAVFLGYWQDEDKTKEMIGSDRWLKTGDLATLDPYGYAAIKGRKKDVIIRGGENIYPAELENFFMTHPSVREAQVFGVPDPRLGEEVAVWLKQEKGSQPRGEEEELTEEAFRAWCKGKIAHFKIPRHVLVKEVFPLTVSGKVQKFRMRELTIEERGLRS